VYLSADAAQIVVAGCVLDGTDQKRSEVQFLKESVKQRSDVMEGTKKPFFNGSQVRIERVRGIGIDFLAKGLETRRKDIL
jgi:hypothetical protein